MHLWGSFQLQQSYAFCQDNIERKAYSPPLTFFLHKLFGNQHKLKALYILWQKLVGHFSGSNTRLLHHGSACSWLTKLGAPHFFNESIHVGHLRMDLRTQPLAPGSENPGHYIVSISWSHVSQVTKGFQSWLHKHLQWKNLCKCMLVDIFFFYSTFPFYNSHHHSVK